MEVELEEFRDSVKKIIKVLEGLFCSDKDEGLVFASPSSLSLTKVDTQQDRISNFTMTEHKVFLV